MLTFLAVIALIVLAFGVLVLIANAPVPAPNPSPTLLSTTVVEMNVPADGKEQFTPLLEVGRMYRLRAKGAFMCCDGGFFGIGDHQADGAYYTDRLGNFTRAYHGLSIAGKSIKNLDEWQEDRCAHEYQCVIDGLGARIPVMLLPEHGYSYGSLLLSIEPLPIGTASPVQQREARKIAKRLAEEASEKAKQQAEDAARRQQEQLNQQQAATLAQTRAAEALQTQQAQDARELQAQRAVINQQVRDLAIRIHHERNFLDPKFCEHFVNQHHAEVLGPLRAAWSKEYETLMAQHELVIALRQQAPQVLEWFEHRVDMIVVAEQLAILPAGTSVVLTERRITARSIAAVEAAVNRLFELRDDIDRWREAEVLNGSTGSTARHHIQGALRVMEYQFEFLKSYGITADTPEQAEDSFFELCPFQPVLTVYEQLMQRLQAGEQISPDAVRSRLEDLFREEIILQAKRRRTIRTGRENIRDAMDARLSVLRQESTQLRDFLKSIGCSVEFADYREREESREDQFFKLLQEKQRVIEALQRQGDADTVEHVEALYAQEQAKLFGTDEENYT